MINPLEFRFELERVADIAAWGEEGNRTLHWFGLTYGWQCLETSAGRLLEYGPRFRPAEKRWVDYPVARLLEDLLEIWPLVRDPVPDDIASRFLGWYSKAQEQGIFEDSDDPDLAGLWEQACSWWHHRRLDFGYLTLAPEMHLWLTGSQVTIKWDASGADPAGTRWAVQRAMVSVPFTDAQAAVEGFCRGLISAMAQRVATIEREGWRRRDCDVDVSDLVAEHQKRRIWAEEQLVRSVATDWERIRRIQDLLKIG